MNEELVLFLSNNDFSKNELNFILNHKKVNITKSDINKSLIIRKLISYVNENEGILLEILLQLGFNYKRE